MYIITSFWFESCDEQPTWVEKINEQKKITALDRQVTQQQIFESPTVTPPGIQVNTSICRYINSAKGTSSRMYTVN